VDEWLSSIINSTTVTVDASEALRTHAVCLCSGNIQERKQNRRNVRIDREIRYC